MTLANAFADRLAEAAAGPFVKLVPQGFVLVCPRPCPPLLFDLITKLTDTDSLTDFGGDAVGLIMATHPALSNAWQSLSTEDRTLVEQRIKTVMYVQPITAPDPLTTSPPSERMPCTRCHGAQEIKLSESPFALLEKCPQCEGTGFQP